MIDADDLALLSGSFTAALAAAPGAGEADVALFELGWADVLDAAPMQGIAAMFAAMGATGATSGGLDDVVAHALGVATGPSVCVVLPAPHRSSPCASLTDGRLMVDGLVSSRIDHCTVLLIPIGDDRLFAAEPAAFHVADVVGLDPDRPFRRVRVDLEVTERHEVEHTGTWTGAVRDARTALAHQMIASSRGMLAVASQHALDRVQFGRAIASFQALRHKLAESLAAIEAAAAVVELCDDGCDPLLAAVAKSLAGRAARTTATHAQQVLAGIGFTTDHQFHRALKRTLVLDTLFGSARSLPTEIGRALVALNGAPRLVEL